MEITESMVYWITRLDGVKESTEIVGLLGVILVGIGVPLFAGMKADFGMGDEEVCPVIQRAVKRWLPIWLICLILAIGSLFIPTTKEMCVIKVLPTIANNEHVQDLPSDIVELAHEWLEELKPKKDE